MIENRMRTIAIVNKKGGVGKDITTRAMSQILATKYGCRCLIVDIDPQGNTSSFYNKYSYDIPGLENLITGEADISACIHHTGMDKVYLLPSNGNLEYAALDILSGTRGEPHTILKNALQKVQNDYDFCLINCPPSTGILTTNALTAADDIIIPIKLDASALDGMEELMQDIEEINTAYNPDIDLVSCLVTMFTRDSENIKAAETLRNSQYNVFDNHIRYSKRINAWTFEQGKSLLEFTPRSGATIDYKNLTEEYLQEIGRRGHKWQQAEKA